MISDVTAIDRAADDFAVDPGVDELGKRLLDAAAEVFAERGYEKAGVAEIARRAGVTTGAIYARYRGKAELLVEAIDPHAGDEMERLFADHRFDGRMSDVLLLAGSDLVSQGGIDPETSSLLLESIVAARRHPEVAAVMQHRVLERESRLSEIIELAKIQGDVDPSIDSSCLVAFCHAVGFGFLLMDALGHEMPDPEAWRELIVRLIDALPPATASPTQ